MLTDNIPPSVRVFYRLKQTDFNGLFSRSQIVSVNVPDGVPSPNEPFFNIHGNPAVRGGNTTIARSERGEALISISDIKGNEVYRQSIQASASPIISIRIDQRFPSGLYLIKVLQEGRREVKKLLVR